jgi:hypothetical protein
VIAERDEYLPGVRITKHEKGAASSFGFDACQQLSRGR